MAEAEKNIKKAVQDSQRRAMEADMGGLKQSIADSRAESSSNKQSLNVIKEINKEAEKMYKNTANAVEQWKKIESAVTALVQKENGEVKAIAASALEIVRKNKNLGQTLKLINQIAEVHKVEQKVYTNSIRNDKQKLNSLSEEYKICRLKEREQSKSQSENEKSNSKAIAAEQKLNSLYDKRKYAYKPTSELLKLAMDRKEALSEYRATHGGSNPTGFSGANQKALTAAGYGMEAAQGIGRGAIGIAQGGLSGLGGAASGLASMIGGLARVGGGAGGAALGSVIPGLGTAAGGAIGTMLGSAVEPILQAGFQAQILLMERGIRGSIFSASLNRMNNFSGGLVSKNRVGVDRKDMSYGEVEGVRDSAALIGSDLSDNNSNNYNEFVQLAATKKLYGETGIKVTRELAYATNNYEEALTGVNKVMASSIQGAKNMNISQDAVATAMANAGKQARFAGTDAMEAMRLYHSVITDKGKLESLKGANIDFSAEGGALVGGMAHIGSKLNLASQVYMASNQGEHDPLLAMFKMRYGNVDASMKDGAVSLGAPKPGEGFFGAKAVHTDLMSHLKVFTAATGGDTRKGMSLLQMYAQGAHQRLSEKDVDMITHIDPSNEKNFEKVAAALEKPETVLEQLRTMESVNQNISNKMAGYLSNIPGIRTAVEFLAGIKHDHGVNVEFLSNKALNNRFSEADMADRYKTKSSATTVLNRNPNLSDFFNGEALWKRSSDNVGNYKQEERKSSGIAIDQFLLGADVTNPSSLTKQTAWALDSHQNLVLTEITTRNISIPKAGIDAQRKTGQ